MFESIDVIAILIVTCCHVIGGIAAFGSAMLSIPLLVLWWGGENLPHAVFFVLSLGLLQAALLYVQNWRYTKLQQTWIVHLPALLALPLGPMIVGIIPRNPVIFLLGTIIAATALFNLKKTFGTPSSPDQKEEKTPLKSVTFLCGLLGGMIHGAFGVGGSVLVLTMQRAAPQQEHFRTAMALLWLSLGIMYVLSTAGNSTAMGPTITTFIIASLGVLSATFLGNYIAKKSSRIFFARLVAILLLGGSLSLFVSIG